MDFPIHIDTSMGLPIVYFKGSRVEFSKSLLLSLKIVLIVANSADLDKMQHDAAFHLGLHCSHSTRLGVFTIESVNRKSESK